MTNSAQWPLQGRTVLVTGGTGGIGYQTASVLAQRGAQVLADQVRAAVSGLDVLVNNVGGLYQTRWDTADGYEATLAMNFVGPFALTASCSHSCGQRARPLRQRGLGRLQAVEA